MTVSVILRLVPEALALGELVGEATLVATGESVPVRNTAELVAVLTASRGRRILRGGRDEQEESQQ